MIATQPDLLDIDDYHADRTAISHSALEHFHASPERYKAWLDGTLADDDSEALRIGQMFHSLVLEPEHFSQQYVRGIKVDKRYTAGKAAWAEFCQTNAGKEVADPGEWDIAQECAAAIRANDRAMQFLSQPGDIEKPLVWTDEATGLRCKCRPDFLGQMPGHSGDLVCIDLKCVRDADERAFRGACWSYGYYRQAAWYLDGVYAATGKRATFGFIAVSKGKPNIVRLWTPKAHELAKAAEENATDLENLKRCLDSGDWLARAARYFTAI